MAELEPSHVGGEVLPEDFGAVCLAILVPIQDDDVANSPQEALPHVPDLLLVIEEVVTVDGRFAEHDLEQLQIGLVLDVDIDCLLAEGALLEAVVLFLQLANHA